MIVVVVVVVVVVLVLVLVLVALLFLPEKEKKLTTKIFYTLSFFCLSPYDADTRLLPKKLDPSVPK